MENFQWNEIDTEIKINAFDYLIKIEGNNDDNWISLSI